MLDSVTSSESIVQAALLSGQFALLATAVLLGFGVVAVLVTVDPRRAGTRIATADDALLGTAAVAGLRSRLTPSS